ncbi:MAG: glycosyltransferase family 2 protein [Balneolaceae bacterium]|nr:glycosyltransferase family 2 protein [Balneolaceae bacterium]
MIYLLYIALAYLLITSFVMLWNKTTFSPLRSLKNYVLPTDTPKVSICIPARNEEGNIERCVRSALNQQYPNLEVLVLDDDSTDETPRILYDLKEEYPYELILLSGKPKPDDWLGKPWACQQLGEAASGNVIIFIDADVWLEPDTVTRTIRTMGGDVLDFLTIWPQQKLGSFWEKTIVPLVYYALTTLLPFAYVKKPPKWIPSVLRQKTGPMFAAACGQFMAFKRSAYDKIGGHQSVKDEIVEDVALAKKIKGNSLIMDMYNGISSVHCRMYNSQQELFEGFRKNFFAGFSYNIPLFVGMGLLHIIVFILPYVGLISGLLSDNTLMTVLSASAILIVMLQRLILAKWFKWKPIYSLTHLLGVIWFQRLGVTSLQDFLGDGNTTWKGRDISQKKK